METEPTQNAEELAQKQDDNIYIPFDGFVNVNDVIKKRRQLRNNELNITDEHVAASNLQAEGTIEEPN